jgi:hypothetical protein
MGVAYVIMATAIFVVIIPHARTYVYIYTHTHTLQCRHLEGAEGGFVHQLKEEINQIYISDLIRKRLWSYIGLFLRTVKRGIHQ